MDFGSGGVKRVDAHELGSAGKRVCVGSFEYLTISSKIFTQVHYSTIT